MSESIIKTLTVTNGAYTIGDVVGGLITFEPKDQVSRSFFIPSIKLFGVVAIPYSLRFLNADIATTVADNGALVLVAADALKNLGSIPILAADYIADPAGTFNDATVRNSGLLIQTTSNKFYAYLVATAVTSPGTTTIYLTVDIVEFY